MNRAAILFRNARLIVICKLIIGLMLPTVWAEALAGPETPARRDARMQWWREARFGMFVHWGLYSGLAGSWEGRKLQGRESCARIQNKIGLDPYTYAAGAVPRFQPKPGFASQWAQVARQAGCRYVVFTTKHHDGFALHDSAVTDYDAGDIVGRDLVREIVEALRAEGLRIGFYHSLIDWHHPQYDFTRTKGLPFPEGARAISVFPRDHDRYLKFLHAQVRELSTHYGQVDIFWWDYSWPGADGEFWKARELMSLVRRASPQVIMNNRLYRRQEAGWDVATGKAGRQLDPAYGDFTTPERYAYTSPVPGLDWESCITMNESWGFHEHDHAWKPAGELIRILADIAGKGGNLLLNVGPAADGSIPAESVERMAAIGKWMQSNQESIYGTRASPLPQSPWGRCTAKSLPDGNTRLYLHVFDWPADGRLVIGGLAQEALGAKLLARPDEKIGIGRVGETVVLTLPGKSPDAFNAVIALDLRGILH